ncbi:MAG: hypothetical protein AAGF23_12715, partial [Acidobacteriota bacterium]
MPNPVVDHLCRGTYIFVRPEPADITRVIPDAENILPMPQKIFQKDEKTEPLIGLPILRSRPLDQLGKLFAEYLQAEEEAQAAAVTNTAFDSQALQTRWELYRAALTQTLENTLVSSIGVDYTAIFWLHHSLEASRLVKDVPKRLRRRDSALGRDHGDTVKYRVLDRWLKRVARLHQDLSDQLSEEMGVDGGSLFPELLGIMVENVLIFSEDYVSPDLSELGSFFRGFLQIDGRAFRARLAALSEWHAALIAQDPVLRAAADELLGVDTSDPQKALFRPGYVRFLAKHPSYDAGRLLDDESLDRFEEMLLRLQTFELLHALRKMVIYLTRDADGTLVCRDRTMNTTWVGGPPVLHLSSATRPIDFAAPWVVNPMVKRFGLVYDITDFSATLSILGRSERSALENAFRMTVQFQRKVDLMAAELGLRLEKYLGDGAFYSSRRSRELLVLAVEIQRLYPRFVARGFPFDRGLRIAINHGEYRLLPLEREAGAFEPRYEYFGHGLVELSRLTTGKKTQQVDTFRTYLVSQGYPESAVNKFFAPLMKRDAELVSKIDEARDFYAYINANRALINEGVVATEPLIQHLGEFSPLYYARQHGRGFIGTDTEGLGGESLRVGFRKLGGAHFKGLDPLAVFEIVDGADWDPAGLQKIPDQPLGA